MSVWEGRERWNSRNPKMGLKLGKTKWKSKLSLEGSGTGMKYWKNLSPDVTTMPRVTSLKHTIRSGGWTNRSSGFNESTLTLIASIQLFRTPFQVNFRSILSVFATRTQPWSPFLQTMNEKIQCQPTRRNRQNWNPNIVRSVTKL